MEKELTEDRLMLMSPTSYYADQVMAYREEMIKNGDDLDGCAGLEDTENFFEWIDFDRRLEKKYGPDCSKSRVYLGIRKEDRELVGILDYRSPLTKPLLEYGGNIGYSIKPSERGNRYAEEMLRLVLPVCKANGEEKVLICCDKANEASRLTIVRNGGVLENEVDKGSYILQRYWIALS
ncbi:MAG: GNAT family N-acetyltransferase [Oscillospiraceae bacterium]|nr:GNAT family N-acetyltransferase [Oscillospiraceae bacterium]